MSKNEFTKSYLVSGDSISKGVILNDDQGKYVVLKDNYISLLETKLSGIIHNTAQFGNTIIRGIRKLKKDVLNYHPDIVVMEFGGNDCDFNWDEVAQNPQADHQPKTDFITFENKLREAVNYLKNNNIVPVLFTLPPLNADRYLKWISNSDSLAEASILKFLGSVTTIYWWQEKYSSAVLKIATETNTRWIDIRGAFLRYPDFSKLLCLDGIHPNALGHQIIANKIFNFIKSDYAFLLKNEPDND